VVAAGPVDGEDVRPLAVGQPLVPVAELGPVDHHRLGLRLLLLLLALLVAGVVRRVRPGPDDGVDGFRVAAPFQVRRPGRQVRQPPGLAAERRDDVNLRLLVAAALGGERDQRPVWRPLRVGAFAADAGELPLRLPVGGQQPQVAAALVLVHVGAGDLDDAPLAVRRDRRRPDAGDLPQVERRDRPLRRRVGGNVGGDDEGEEDGGAAHDGAGLAAVVGSAGVNLSAGTAGRKHAAAVTGADR
jgi:hypothetical protein